VVIPVYNGRDKIQDTLENVQSRMNDLEAIMFDTIGSDKDHARADGDASGRSVPGEAGDWFEIIVVNDGSVDDTRKVIEVVKEKDRRIRMISYGTNMGKGYAIKRGILESRGKYVIFMDGDGDIGAETLSTYLQRLKDADIIIASKYHSSSVVKIPRARRFLSRCFHLFVKALIPLRVSDTQVGLKAGRGDAFRKIFQSVLVKRYAFDVEMLAVATLLGLKIVEMPVKIELKSSLKRKEIVRMALDVLGIAYRLRIIRSYQKQIHDFVPARYL
jgi:glycosyltransferase involved in cell wall biosynthesis